MSDKNIFTVSLDAGALILDFDDISSNISGYTKKEVLEVFSDLFHGQNTHWEFTNNIRCKDGSTKTIKWVNNIIKDDKNRPTEIYSRGVVV